MSEITTPQAFAAEVDRQIAEYECLSDTAIENVRDDMLARGANAALVGSLMDDHFRYRTCP